MRHVTLLACVVIVGISGCNQAGPSSKGESGPAAEKEGESWSHAELLAHFASHGLKLKSFHTNSGGLHGPAVVVVEPEVAEKHELKTGLSVDWKAPYPFVFIQKVKTAQDAKDEAGAVASGRTESSKRDLFAWGRFMIAGDAAVVAKMKSALGVK